MIRKVTGIGGADDDVKESSTRIQLLESSVLSSSPDMHWTLLSASAFFLLRHNYDEFALLPFSIKKKKNEWLN